VRIPYQQRYLKDGKLKGAVANTGYSYGNIWTNIPGDLFQQLNPQFGDSLHVIIYHRAKKYMKGICLYRNFALFAKRQTRGLSQ